MARNELQHIADRWRWLDPAEQARLISDIARLVAELHEPVRRVPTMHTSPRMVIGNTRKACEENAHE